MGGAGSGRKPGPKKAPAFKFPRGTTMAKSVILALDRTLAEVAGSRWPAVKWQRDPVGFVKEVLKEKPLRHQRQILRAFAASRRARVAVTSGQKVGKTKTEIWIALWAYCSFPDAQVIITATIADQIRTVVWRELKKTIRDAKAKNPDFDIEDPAENPAIGLNAPDGRCIRGFKGREVESMAGISGENIFFLNDEASSLSEGIAQAITGNTSAGARILYISNPTRTEGPFFDAFHTKKHFWRTFTLSAVEIAQYLHAKGLVKRYPALASLETIRSWVLEYGEDSPFFIVRAKGEFLRNEMGKVITLDAITQATARFADEAASGGRLTFGVDPAGPGDGGDEYSIARTRGNRCEAIAARRGVSEDAGVVWLREEIARERRGDEIPHVHVDAEGPIGSSLYVKLKGISETLRATRPELLFEVFSVRASNRAKRKPELYDRTREEIWANGAKWINGGGCFAGDHKLEAELHIAEWSTDVNGKLKVTPKPEMREKLGRSPDRADSFLLSIWEPAPWLKEDEDEGAQNEARVSAVLGGDMRGGDSSRRPMGLLDTAGASFGDPYELLRRSGG